MAGGDLLFFVAFIIFPTVVLVSCVWSLVLIKKGVLLPERRLPVRPEPVWDADDAEDDEATELGDVAIVDATTAIDDGQAAINETSEFAVVAEDANSSPMATDQVDEQVDVTDEVASPAAGPDDPAEAIPPVDLSVEQPLDSGSDTRADELDAALTQSVPDQPVGEPVVTPLIVPLEEDPPTVDAPRIQQPRKPARRLGQFRTMDEQPARPRPRVGQRRTGARGSVAALEGPSTDASVGEGEGVVEGGDGPADLVRRDDE
ncbi:MAG: hypothetical protein ACRD1H_09370 [Vicinamibacterales bacterium]